jgi:hypothetical protein
VNTTMRKAKKSVGLSAKELARYRCNDCSVNVVIAGECYMLNDEIWEDQLGLGWDDNLCIGCLEQRLGRKVSMANTQSAHHVVYPFSKRLCARLFGKRNGKWIVRWIEQPKNRRSLPARIASAVREAGAHADIKRVLETGARRRRQKIRL